MKNEIEKADEQWKSDLILEIARRKGFFHHELSDVHQQVYLSIANFKYDPQKANGASERTILSMLIEKRLTFIQRTELRRRQNGKKIQRVCGPSKYQPFTDNDHLDHERKFELATDVHDAIAGLNPQEQAVCRALSEGISRAEIAQKLGVSHYEIDCVVQAIAEQFAAKNIHEWVRK